MECEDGIAFHNEGNHEESAARLKKALEKLEKK